MTEEKDQPGEKPADQPPVEAGGGAGSSNDATGTGDAAEGSRATEVDDTTTATPRRRGWGLAVLLVLLIATVAGGGGYLYWQIQSLMTQTAGMASQSSLERLADRHDTTLGALSGRVSNLNEQLESRLQSLARIENRLADGQSERATLIDRVDQLYRRAQSDADDWRLAEAAYLAQLAIQRLELMDDVGGALEALERADRRLAGLGGAGVDRREAVAAAVDRLLEVERPQHRRINRGLDALAGQIERLPLAASALARAEATDSAPGEDGRVSEGWQGRLERAWQRLRQGLSELVVVSRDRDVQPLPDANARFLLEQNLLLQIESARVSALRGEAAPYQSAIERLDAWVAAYFDPAAESVIAARDTLATLAERRVAIDPPAIRPLLAPVLDDGVPQ
jgi:uroporphyrin-3 C-methyltransferase